MSSWSVSLIVMVNSLILNSYMQNTDLYVVPLHHLAAISKSSWAKRLGLASVLTGVLYSHVKYWQRAPFLVLTLFKAEVWCEISQCSQNQTTRPISRYGVFSNRIMGQFFCTEERFTFFIPRTFTRGWQLSVLFSTNLWVENILFTKSFKNTIFVNLSLPSSKRHQISLHGFSKSKSVKSRGQLEKCQFHTAHSQIMQVHKSNKNIDLLSTSVSLQYLSGERCNKQFIYSASAKTSTLSIAK